MKRSLLTILMAAATVAGASAHSVLIDENFNGTYPTESFPTLLDLDQLPLLPNFSPLFLDGKGVAQPWWKGKDSNSSDDAFVMSHSAYQGGGTSNDWMISKPITIPTTGYTLKFGAQSYAMRSGDRLSNLDVYITETMPSKGNLPTEADLHIDQVPIGKSSDYVEKDFTYYEISLDKYVGKTVYISFLNANTDKDILCIDDVLVQRLDEAELTATAETYVLNGEFEVYSTIKETNGVDLTGLTLTFDPNTGDAPTVIEGIDLKAGEEKAYTFKANVAADKYCNWTVTLSKEGMPSIIESGSTTGLAFIPYHRILLEESTGLWCGNCPIGMYAMENMVHDEDMSKFVVPVAVHISGSGNDFMIDSNYSYLFAVNFAPGIRIARDTAPKAFNVAADGGVFDKTNPLSVAYRVCQEQKEVSLIDIALDAKFNVEGNDTTSISAEVTITPAMTLPGNRYAIGFSLTENNVGVDNNAYWCQLNYYSGVNLESGLGGFTSLPEKIYNWRYMDVARATYGYRGHEDISLPEILNMEQPYTYSVTLDIPDTYKENEKNGYLQSPAIVASNLTVVAYVLDKENDNAAINAIAFPMTEAASHRLTIAEMAERITAGVEDVAIESTTQEAEYYTLQGVKVANPTPGIYVVRRGAKATKEIVR